MENSGDDTELGSNLESSGVYEGGTGELQILDDDGV